MRNEIDKIFEEEWKKRCKPAEYCGVGVSIIDKEDARNMFHCIGWLQIAKIYLAEPQSNPEKFRGKRTKQKGIR